MTTFRGILVLLSGTMLIGGCERSKSPPQPGAADTTSVKTEAISTIQVAPPTSAADIGGTPPGTVMTPGYIDTVGRMIYVWGWPLMNHYNRSLAMVDVPEPGRNGGILPVAPPGSISMLTDYIKADQNFVACPNQDTVYGAGYQHLDTLPVVIQVPDFGDRFFVYQMADARTESFCSIGKQYDSKPGFYLLAGPNWKGEVPKGITGVCRSSTDLVAVLPRIFMDDTAEDRAAVKSLVNQVVLYPLNQFDGKMKTKDWASTPSFPAPSVSGSGEMKFVSPEKFFDELPTIIKGVPPLPGEEALYSTINSVLQAAASDPKVKEGLVKAAVAAENEVISPLFDFRNNGSPVGNGWTSPSNGAQWGFDYLSRTASAKSNIYDNAANETRYIYTDVDQNGVRLSGAANAMYTVTFPKGQTPPVKGFWSLTLYNKHHLFEPNPINRFGVGTKNKDLKPNDDGSLTLYIQHASPGPDRASNWLPAPADEFSLYIRAYWPDAAIIERTWSPPAVTRTQ
ncbi:DUF1254 domain-containing protein [Stenotrophomonas sp. SY1]|uniref:DUF1254 domain-containing protein n=1 Tax=Stenotrophomonas sp. SY1 TaxID=477235 RepID=UPI001E405C6B|nr:DUF1254 domain-containing protein [Stenotrophomonas sp. SY1]MCD9088133.1 DUF1214 domain-containing protein [Stenotrophomonas sp. SY1]